MYFHEEEKTSFQKLIISLSAACATIFSVTATSLKFLIHLLAGDANQNGPNKEVNS